jgi:hypothetical protein
MKEVILREVSRRIGCEGMIGGLAGLAAGVI